MKSWRNTFALTLWEQRVIILLLSLLLLFATISAYRATASKQESQPSPSPGILP